MERGFPGIARPPNSPVPAVLTGQWFNNEAAAELAGMIQD